MDKKIAVIGAGPAGITAALELKDRGFNNVTVFGDFQEAQLKTMHIDNITFDVAACFLHLGYWHTVVPLVRRFGLTVNYVPHAADFVDKKLQPIPKNRSGLINTYLAIPYFLLFFLGWWCFHKTAYRKKFFDTMETFMERKGLEALSSSFILGPGGVGQGYGFLDEVSAYHAFRWFRPRLFLTPLLTKFNFGVATISEGFETLFKSILDELNYVNEKIAAVRPAIDQVELRTEKGERLMFDEVIIACPLNKIRFPHAYLMKEEYIDQSLLFSFLFTSPTPPTFKDRAYLSDYIQSKTKNKGLVIRKAGITDSGDYLYWVVGYKLPDTPLEALKELVIEQIEQELELRLNSMEYFNCFTYNLRFSKKALEQGIPQQLEQLQGYKHIWYSGGLLSHWDISSIYEHNKNLVNRLHFKASKRTLFSYLGYKIRAFFSWLRLI